MTHYTKKTPEVIEEVLRRLSDGEPLAAICRSDEKFPHPVVWGRWVNEDPELQIAYARARDVGADAIATQALDLIDEEPARIEGRIDPGHVQWRRAQVETRLKLLAKWNPKLYGDKSTTELTGKDGGPVQTEAVGATPEEMRALTNLILQQAKDKAKK
jgi:hypothetical protein